MRPCCRAAWSWPAERFRRPWGRAKAGPTACFFGHRRGAEPAAGEDRVGTAPRRHRGEARRPHRPGNGRPRSLRSPDEARAGARRPAIGAGFGGRRTCRRRREIQWQPPGAGSAARAVAGGNVRLARENEQGWQDAAQRAAGVFSSAAAQRDLLATCGENARVRNSLQAVERDRVSRFAQFRHEKAAITARLRQAQGTLDQTASAARLINGGAGLTSAPLAVATPTPARQVARSPHSRGVRRCRKAIR